MAEYSCTDTVIMVTKRFGCRPRALTWVRSEACGKRLVTDWFVIRKRATAGYRNLGPDVAYGDTMRPFTALISPQRPPPFPSYCPIRQG